MSLGRSPGASESATRLAERMLGMDDVMWEILDETVPESDDSDPVVRESGRTLCGDGSNIKGPLARFPTAVELAECPRGTRGGTWHSHVTRDQLKKPTNSLPDMANVLFGDVDVSVVVGTQEAEAVIAPGYRDGAVGEFRDALGADVSSTDEVVDAILAGHVRDPTDVRRRVRRRMGGLFKRVRTGYSDLDGRVERASIPASSVVKFDMVEAQRYHNIQQAGVRHRDHHKNPVRDPVGMREHCRATTARVKEAAQKTGVQDTAANVAMTTAIQRVFGALL